MRPNQQNNKNRSRGRNNNGGRKHTNPLSRNYESNGPDVKVRGNASHIAEKYVQLARDAQASGDSVMAENYFQHAEHYFRIVMASQPQGMPSPQFGQDSDIDDEFAEEGAEFTQRNDEQPRVEQGQRQDRENRENRQPHENVEASSEEQPAREERQPRPERPRRERRPRREQPVENAEAVEASSAPVDAPAQEAAPAPAPAPENAEAGEAAPKPRRTRRPRRTEGEDPANAPQPEVGELPAFLTGNATAAE